jgi:hypothetical protein
MGVVLAVAAVGLVVVLRVTSSSSTLLPAATPLSDSVIVVGAAGMTTAIDPATGQQVPLATVFAPDGTFPEEFGTAVGGGDVVVLTSIPPTHGGGTSPTGATAVAIRPGSRQERVLGPAIGAVAGIKPGTVWLWAGDAYKSTTLAQSHCCAAGARSIYPSRPVGDRRRARVLPDQSGCAGDLRRGPSASPDEISCRTCSGATSCSSTVRRSGGSPRTGQVAMWWVQDAIVSGLDSHLRETRPRETSSSTCGLERSDAPGQPRG